MILPLREALKHAPPLPEVGPEDPGPFAFADERRVRSILDAAGYGDVGVTPHDIDLDIAAPGVRYLIFLARMLLYGAVRQIETRSEAPTRRRRVAQVLGRR